MAGPPKKRSYELDLEESSSSEEESEKEVYSVPDSSEESNGDYDDDDTATIDGMSSSFPAVSTQRSSISSSPGGAELSTQQPTPGTLKKGKATSTAKKNKKKRKVDDQQQQPEAQAAAPYDKESSIGGIGFTLTSKAPPRKAGKSSDNKSASNKEKKKRATPAKDKRATKNAAKKTATAPPNKEEAPSSRVQEVEEVAKKKKKKSTVATAKQPEKLCEVSKDPAVKSKETTSSQKVNSTEETSQSRPTKAPSPRQAQTKKPEAPPSRPANIAGQQKQVPTETASGGRQDVPAPSNNTSVTAANQPAAAATATKPKKKKMNLQDSIFHHMLIAFKPFTLKSLAKELSMTEAQLNYTMLSLLDKGLVVKKEFKSAKGRAKELYWANHGGKAKEVHVSFATPEEIAEARRDYASVKSHLDSINSVLAAATAVPTNEELTAQLEREEAELKTLRQKLADTKGRIRAAKEQEQSATTNGPPLLGRGGPVKSAAQLARERCPRRTKIRINSMRDEWKKAKAKSSDFVDQLADAMEKKPKDIVKLLDLETDEMVGVTLPPKHVVD